MKCFWLVFEDQNWNWTSIYFFMRKKHKNSTQSASSIDDKHDGKRWKYFWDRISHFNSMHIKLLQDVFKDACNWTSLLKSIINKSRLHLFSQWELISNILTPLGYINNPNIRYFLRKFHSKAICIVYMKPLTQHWPMTPFLTINQIYAWYFEINCKEAKKELARYFPAHDISKDEFLARWWRLGRATLLAKKFTFPVVFLTYIFL